MQRDIKRRNHPILTCDNCGILFESLWVRTSDRFCSPRCRTAARRKLGLDQETRVCSWCQSAFTVRKDVKKEYCSRSCSYAARGKVLPRIERLEYNGRTYSRWPDSSADATRVYYQCGINNKLHLLHVDIWEDAHGPVPPGFHVHHLSGDPNDNRLENLIALSASEHLSHHAKERKDHPVEQICTRCQKVFTTTSAKTQRRFCSARCTNNDRRAAGKGLAKGFCVVCGKEFVARSDSQTKTCGRICGGRLAAKTRMESSA